MNKKQKRNIFFYMLSEEYGRTQQEISTMFSVSQGTVSMGIKEARLLIIIPELQNEITLLRNELAERLGRPKSVLPSTL